MYVGLIGLEKGYDRVNRGALWQVLRIYDVGGKLLNGIKSVYVDSLICVRIKGGESNWFRMDSMVRLVYHVPLVLQCVYERSDEGLGNWDGKEGSEIPQSGDFLASVYR